MERSAAMQLHKYLPLASDRMGTIWALASIKDACVIEYGPAGTTHYGIEGFMQLNSELRSKLYTTHMDDNDIVMGDSTRLEKTIKEVDSVYSPPVIFVLASSISSIIGTDIESICADLHDEVNAKLIPFTGGGFRGDYTLGIREVLSALAMHVVKSPTCLVPKRYNIIGSNIDCYNFAADLREIQNIMENCFGYNLNTVFTAKSSIKEIQEAAGAEFNIVLRSEGVECAQILRDRFEIPYFLGAPYGFKGTMGWIKGLEKVFDLKANEIFLAKQMELSRKLIMRFRRSTFTFKQLNGILAGNYDFLLDVYPFLTEELGLGIQHVLVNHNLKGGEFRGNGFENCFINPSEEEKDKLLQDNPNFILGDGVLLEMGKNVPVKIQVSNPNLHAIQVFEQTPFMGYNGAIYLIEILLNQLRINNKELKSSF
jgi:nitrogenase molybdenum-iron protein alpha/beta subunit